MQSPTTVRLTEETRKQIDAYTKATGCTQAQALENAWETFWPVAKMDIQAAMAVIARRLEGETE